MKEKNSGKGTKRENFTNEEEEEEEEKRENIEALYERLKIELGLYLYLIFRDA